MMGRNSMLDQSALCLRVLGRCHQAEGTPILRRHAWMTLLSGAVKEAGLIADAETRRGCFRSVERTLAKLEAEYAALPWLQRGAA